MSGVDNTFELRKANRNISGGYEMALNAMEGYVRDFGDTTPSMSIAAFALREFFDAANPYWLAQFRPNADDGTYWFESILAGQEPREFLRIECVGTCGSLRIIRNLNEEFTAVKQRMIDASGEMRHTMSRLTYASIGWLTARVFSVIALDDSGEPGKFSATWAVQGKLIKLTFNQAVLREDWALIEKFNEEQE